MLEIKTDNEIRKLAEVSDVATWKVETEGTAFKPGIFYTLGAISTTTFSYTLIEGQEGNQWAFSFTTGDDEVTINHPSDVGWTNFKKVPAHSRVEIFALQDGGKKYIAPLVQPIEHSVHVIDGEIQDNWNELIWLMDHGDHQTTYSVGDQIIVLLNKKIPIVLQIAGFNKDELSGDTTETAKITFLARTLIGAPLPFYNSSSTSGNVGATSYSYANWGGEYSGYLRKFNEEFLLPALPEEVRRRIVRVKKTHPAFESTTATTAITQTSNDEIWIPSKEELDTGGKYDALVQANTSRIRGTADGTARVYLLRSAATASTVDTVTATGSFGSVSIKTAQYICFGFCIN